MSISDISADDGDGGVHPPESESGGLTRRSVLVRGGTVTGGAIGTVMVGDQVVPRFSPIGRASAACVPCVVAGAALVGYVAGVAHERYTTPDSEEIVDAVEFEDHLRIYNEAREIYEVEDETLLASIERDATGLQSKAREQAVIDIYETVVDGGSRADAEAAAQDAIDSVFAIPQKDVATRVNSLFNGIFANAWDDTETLMYTRSDSGNIKSFDHHTGHDASANFQFYDGETFEVYGKKRRTDYEAILFDPFEAVDYELGADYTEQQLHDEGWTEVGIPDIDPADYGMTEEEAAEYDDWEYVNGFQPIADHNDYKQVLDAIADARDQVMSEVEALLSNHYDGVEAGDLSIQDMLSPSAMDESLNNAETWGELALYFRQLGLAEAEAPVIISIDASEVDSVDGDRVELEGLLGWSIPSDVEDTYIPIGTEVDPSAYPGQFRMAAEYEDENGETDAEMLTLTSPFVIETVDSSIEGAERLYFLEREVVTSDMDPERAAEIYRQHREAEESARDRTIKLVTEGGGGAAAETNDFLNWLGIGDVSWLNDNIAGVPIWGWLAGAVAYLRLTDS